MKRSDSKLGIQGETGTCVLHSLDSISQVQFGHRQFPQIHVMPCGDWVVTFSWTDDAFFSKAGLLRSRDQGRTWNEEGWSTDTGVIVPLGGNQVGIFDSYYPLDRGNGDFAVQSCFSSDGGRSFGPVDLCVPVHCPGAEVMTLADLMQAYFAIPCYPWNRFFKANGYPHIAPGWPETAKQIRFGGAGPSSNTVLLPDGRLISMNYCRSTIGPRLPAGYYVAFALESGDRGRSWRQVGTVPWDSSFGGETALFGNSGFTEAGLARLADGTLLILLRAGSGLPLATSRSVDDGRTWSRPEVVSLENTGETAKGILPLLVRMASGWLAAVYGRPGIHLMIDRTGTGRHWQHEFEFKAIETRLATEQGVTGNDFYSTENVGLAELVPGELAVTYDLWGWKEAADKPSVRQTIRMARLLVLK